MEIIKNQPLIERKFFLMRAVENENMTEAEAEKEISELNNQIKQNFEEFMVDYVPRMKEEIKAIRSEQVLDGNFKRSMANYIIKLFGSHLSNAELKGIFRQGYKITRGYS